MCDSFVSWRGAGAGAGAGRRTGSGLSDATLVLSGSRWTGAGVMPGLVGAGLVPVGESFQSAMSDTCGERTVENYLPNQRPTSVSACRHKTATVDFTPAGIGDLL